MQCFRRLLRVLRSECLVISAVCRCRGCVASKAILLAGLVYQFGPESLPTGRLPEFDWTGKALVAVAALLLARALVPANHDGHARVGSGSWRRFRLARWRSGALSQRLLVARRLRRLGRHGSRFPAGLLARIAAARGRRGIGERLFALAGYRLWWDLRAPFAPGRVGADPPLVVIGGAARSGTTLLRTMLGRHPMVASLPETTVFLRRVSSPADLAERLGWEAALIAQWQRDSRSQAEFIRRVQHAVLRRSGKRLWVEKTPKNVFRFGFVRRQFPQAKLVHIVRDGRDAVCSLRRTPFAKLDHAAWDSIAAARRCGVQWRNSVRAGLRFRGDPAYFELRYEDLVRDPEPVLRRLLQFLDLPWDDRMLRASVAESRERDALRAAGAVFDASVARWQRDLSAVDRRALRPLIGPLLVELGYADGLRWPVGTATAKRASEAPRVPIAAG